MAICAARCIQCHIVLTNLPYHQNTAHLEDLSHPSSQTPLRPLILPHHPLPIILTLQQRFAPLPDLDWMVASWVGVRLATRMAVRFFFSRVRSGLWTMALVDVWRVRCGSWDYMLRCDVTCWRRDPVFNLVSFELLKLEQEREASRRLPLLTQRKNGPRLQARRSS